MRFAKLKDFGRLWLCGIELEAAGAIVRIELEVMLTPELGNAAEEDEENSAEFEMLGSWLRGLVCPAKEDDRGNSSVPVVSCVM